MTMPGHDHDHDHDHPTLPDAAERLGYYQRMEIAVRELLIEKGIVTADAIRRAIEAMDARTPEQGARIVARAWREAALAALVTRDSMIGVALARQPESISAD